MQVSYQTISAFTRDGKGGNPAAVILEADRFSAEQKQRLAAKIGLSETAFIGRSSIADFKLDFFKPTRQIAHCGHATIAGFSYLKQLGKITADESSNETVDGRREVTFRGDEAFMEQAAPRFSYPVTNDLLPVMNAVGLTKKDLLFRPVIVNTGNSFLLLQVKNENILQHLKPQFGPITGISEKYGLIGFYVFCLPLNASSDATARMFAPAYGIEEESATGMAAGPLAGFLYHFGTRKTDYIIEQGKFMQPPSASVIKASLMLKNNEIKSLSVGGGATVMRQSVVDID